MHRAVKSLRNSRLLRSPRIQVSPRVCTCIPYWWDLSGGRCRGSSATPFQFIVIIDCQPHPTVHHRRPSFSGRRCSCLEQSAYLVTSAPSVAVFRSRLKTHLFNISYSSPLWLYSACAVTLSCFGHYNCSCLLTYLLTLKTVEDGKREDGAAVAVNDTGLVIDGGWSDWSPWSSCSVSCGQGRQSRYRTCDHPAPSSGGQFCDGSMFHWQHCQVLPCRGLPVRCRILLVNCMLTYRVVQKKRYPGFNFAITSVNVHRF